METINDLVGLLMYQVKHLYSSEVLIEQAIPSIIAKANHQSLKNALTHHAGLTADQKQRLVQVVELIKEKKESNSIPETALKNETVTSKGMSGLLEEINQLLETKLSNEVKDAAIIASVQKIEHYEICAYGTALAFARQLHQHEAAELLNETLQEEYDADDLLTSLAAAALNKEAIPDDIETDEITPQSVNATEGSEDVKNAATLSISERTINSPGGRAGTSHRRYGTGESRGH